MDGENSIPEKPKRVRKNPTRKWSRTEETALLNFMMENPDVENPSGQTYYKRFAEKNGISIEWKLVRSKVRNMSVTYNKAKAWEGSTGAGSMEGETIKSRLLKMCSFYEEFDVIFGSRITEPEFIEDTLQSDSNAFLNSTENTIEDTTMTPDNTEVQIEILPSTIRKGIYSRTAVSDIMQLQSEMMKIQKQKMDQDLVIKEKEVEIKEREVIVKEREFDLKEKEIYSNEKLKVLELEMKERLAKEEIKLKYK